MLSKPEGLFSLRLDQETFDLFHTIQAFRAIQARAFPPPGVGFDGRQHIKLTSNVNNLLKHLKSPNAPRDPNAQHLSLFLLLPQSRVQDLRRLQCSI